eukprot:1343802-Pyramimonas_sp.AAC.1
MLLPRSRSRLAMPTLPPTTTLGLGTLPSTLNSDGQSCLEVLAFGCVQSLLRSVLGCLEFLGGL